MKVITKEVLGKRLKEVRNDEKLTLKEVEIRSGLSSTHISEIERGMTSPTIGALIRIAHALKKDPSYFIEERELDEVCITTEADRPEEMVPDDVLIEGGKIESLTRGVVCGRIQAYLVMLDPGGSVEMPCLHKGQDVCLYCIEGQVRLQIGSFEGQLAPGDSIHGTLSASPIVKAGEASQGKVVIIIDPREECR